MVVETMRKEGLSYKETERQFELPHRRAASWERIYLEEGPEGLYIERRGRNSHGGGRPSKHLKPEVEEGLIAEV
ncbi:MAG: helix-turn-helix domain-containing protein [Clostridia bacterium]|nr:helix-turn-helix domain-containing protein [Clostridia bacterium]